MNITLSIDDRLVARARRVARASGSSLNQMIRDYVAQIGGTDDVSRDLAELRALSGTGSRRGWKFDRGELHERGTG